MRERLARTVLQWIADGTATDVGEIANAADIRSRKYVAAMLGHEVDGGLGLVLDGSVILPCRENVETALNVLVSGGTIAEQVEKLAEVLGIFEQDARKLLAQVRRKP